MDYIAEFWRHYTHSAGYLQQYVDGHKLKTFTNCSGYGKRNSWMLTYFRAPYSKESSGYYCSGSSKVEQSKQLEIQFIIYGQQWGGWNSVKRGAKDTFENIPRLFYYFNVGLDFRWIKTLNSVAVVTAIVFEVSPSFWSLFSLALAHSIVMSFLSVTILLRDHECYTGINEGWNPSTGSSFPVKLITLPSTRKHCCSQVNYCIVRRSITCIHSCVTFYKL